MQDLRVTNVGPFEDVTFEFDEHVNVFVGPNSSGKSTTAIVEQSTDAVLQQFFGIPVAASAPGEETPPPPRRSPRQGTKPQAPATRRRVPRPESRRRA